MKKWFALFLAVMMVCSMLAACGEDEGVPYVPPAGGTSAKPTDPTDPSEPTDPPVVFDETVLLGQWDLMTYAPGDLLEDDTVDFQLELSMKQIYEFREDGTLIMKMHPDDIDQLADDFVEQMELYLLAGGIYTIYAEEGYTKEELDAELAAEGMTMEQMVKIVMVMLEPEIKAEMIQGMEEDAVLDSDGYLTKTKTYSLVGDMLTLIASDGTEDVVKCVYDGQDTVVIESDEDSLFSGGTTYMTKRDSQ